MTNPDNALGTNGAFGGRTSVNAFNDVLATFDGAGIVSGFAVAPDTGMTVNVGGSGTVRDVAVAEDPFGNRTTVDNIFGDPISVTISTASTTSARIDSIVAYVNSPATASDTSVDNPTACGIISVNGTSGGAPLDSAIRTAITADGGTGSTAYYVVIANVSVPANTTTITSGLISAGKSINLSKVATSGSNGLMSGADKSKLDGLKPNTYSTSEDVVVGTWINGKPLYRRVFQFTTSANSFQYQSQATGLASGVADFAYLDASSFFHKADGWNYTFGTARLDASSKIYADVHCWCRISSDGTTLAYWVAPLFVNTEVTCIFYYTKSSD